MGRLPGQPKRAPCVAAPTAHWGARPGPGRDRDWVQVPADPPLARASGARNLPRRLGASSDELSQRASGASARAGAVQRRVSSQPRLRRTTIAWYGRSNPARAWVARIADAAGHARQGASDLPPAPRQQTAVARCAPRPPLSCLGGARAPRQAQGRSRLPSSSLAACVPPTHDRKADTQRCPPSREVYSMEAGP